MTPTRFNSEYEILNWLSKQEDFARGLAELRAAAAEGTLESGQGLVQKWLSVYDDVTGGRAPAAPRPEADAVRDVQAEEKAGRDALVSRTLLQESQLWAEASREAAARADLAAMRLGEPLARAARWGKAGFWLGLLALLLAAAVVLLLWPTIEPQARALLRFLPGPR